MTTIALNYSRNLFEGFLSGVKNTFASFGKAVVMARAAEVNYQLAQSLQHEYKHMSVAEITHMLNERVRKEVYGD